MSTDDNDISSIYRQAGRPEPSQTLDDAILSASRDAVKKPVAKGPFSGAWPAVASIAAVLVITIILVPIIKQQEPPPERIQPAKGKDSTPNAASEAVLDADRATGMKKMTQTPAAPEQPALLLQQDLPGDDQAMPAPAGLNTRSVKSLPAGTTSLLEKEEETAGADAPAAQRSRIQAADSAPFAILTPEMWEVKVSRLITEGKIDEAETEIGQLQQHYPEYIINPSLLEKLNSSYE